MSAEMTDRDAEHEAWYREWCKEDYMQKLEREEWSCAVDAAENDLSYYDDTPTRADLDAEEWDDREDYRDE